MTSTITHVDGARTDAAGTDAPRTEATSFRMDSAPVAPIATDLPVAPLAADAPVGDAPTSIRLETRDTAEVPYRTVAIAAGALGLGVLAYRGVSALLARRSTPARDEAVPMTPPVATTPIPVAPDYAPAAIVGTDTGAEFIGEPASMADSAPFVASSADDDTGNLIVEVTEIDVVAVTVADDSALTPEHVPTDLMADRDPGAGERAIDAFRPDPTAPVPESMRESLRPATGPATGFAGNRGDFASGLSQADGSK